MDQELEQKLELELELDYRAMSGRAAAVVRTSL